ncbi:DUF3108 domain-containing protein [Jannaschia pohangensis]|uniref:DUF3108 domain-containing protein n=1 Tax=Jannaschia pohangensis TaxID=390807 RepID=A0A1I3QCS3_9RHOB|nr:DUF3108 domain-containing protein [Jannaschia pohangensis]SFJ31708.1 Protein of unknown function [Jannaschia pohangensis]
MSLRPFLALLLLSCPAHAQTFEARYDMSLRGITAGQIALRAREGGGRYSVVAAAKATGAAGALVKYGYDGRAEGRVTRRGLESSVYGETEDDNGETTVTEIRFQDGRPQSVTVTPARDPEPHDIDPTAQRGVMDPLSSLYEMMRPVPRAAACDLDQNLFDGRHVSRLTLGPAQPQADGTIVCIGAYRRIAGYSAEELARRPSVDMTFVYGTLDGDRVQVTEIRAPTPLGDAVLRRR